MMSAATRRIFCTRHGSVLIWMSEVASISRHWITRSESGLAWQKSAMPRRFSASVSALAWYVP